MEEAPAINGHMKSLCIIWHSMTGASKALAEAADQGARTVVEADIRLIAAADAGPDDLRDADGYIFVFPENLAAISGTMKAFFDRSYYSCLGQIEGRPYALIVAAGSDGSNAVRQAERIATGWRLKKVADSMIICTHAQTPEEILAPKLVANPDLTKAQELGAAMAEGLVQGIF
jgi:putative NADPH-quinone reductase